MRNETSSTFLCLLFSDVSILRRYFFALWFVAWNLPLFSVPLRGQQNPFDLVKLQLCWQWLFKWYIRGDRNLVFKANMIDFYLPEGNWIWMEFVWMNNSWRFCVDWDKNSFHLKVKLTYHMVFQIFFNWHYTENGAKRIWYNVYHTFVYSFRKRKQHNVYIHHVYKWKTCLFHTFSKFYLRNS